MDTWIRFPQFCLLIPVLLGYTLVHSQEVCSNPPVVIEGSGVIKTPRYPDYYPSSVTCSWRINAGNYKGVLLEMSAFDLEVDSTKRCKLDYLIVYDGYGPLDDVIGRYCGSEFPSGGVRSSGKYMYLEFVTDDNIERRGFTGTVATYDPTGIAGWPTWKLALAGAGGGLGVIILVAVLIAYALLIL